MQLRNTSIVLILACIAVYVTCNQTLASSTQTLVLTKNSKPASTIVIGKNAVKAAKFAALELQKHISQISGTELPILTADKKVNGTRILVGESEATKKLGLSTSNFSKQQYLIKFLPNTIVLMGKDKNDTGEFVYDYLKNKSYKGWPSPYDEMGTMHAVYDFLRDYCGVKWINPTDYGTYIPKKKTLSVTGSENLRKPFFLYRGGSAGDQYRYQRNGGLWKNHTAGARQYNSHAFGRAKKITKNPHQINAITQAQNLLFIYRMKGGGEQSICNHSFYNYYERFWKKTNNNFEKFQPELFAKGYEKGDKPPQLCYSNPETIKQVIKDIRHYFNNGGYQKPVHSIPVPGYYWGERFFALEPMDNSAFCKCMKCKKQYEMSRQKDRSQHSSYWFNFVNKIAKEIKKTHPDKRLSTLAYMTHEGLPTNTEMEDNVVVHFCISANRTPFNNRTLKKQLNRLEEWKNKQNLPMYLWLYHGFPKEFADNGNFHCFPGHFAHELKRQFNIFNKLDIKGVFFCGFDGEVDNYVTYRLMEDPTLNVDKILDEYFSVYGQSGKPLRKMYELIEEHYCNPKYYPKKQNGEINCRISVDTAWNYLGSAAVMKQLQSYMDEAYSLAVTDQEKHLVKLWDEALWSYMKKGRKDYVKRMNYPIPEVNAPAVPNANGDIHKVDWNNAASIGNKWYRRGTNNASKFRMEGRICHDDNYLYLELTDYVDPAKLEVSAKIACYDDWEIFVAGQRAQPFRQYLIGPTAMTCGSSYGEVNWRQGVMATEYTQKAFGLKAVSDTSGNKWITKLAFPLKHILEHPVKPGDDLFLNIIRVRNPTLAGERPYGIDTWVAYTTVKDVDRLAKIHLEK